MTECLIDKIHCMKKHLLSKCLLVKMPTHTKCVHGTFPGNDWNSHPLRPTLSHTSHRGIPESAVEDDERLNTPLPDRLNRLWPP